MVCHETYKDQNNNWLNPDDVESVDGKTFYLKNKPDEIVVVGPLSPCPNQKKYY